MVTTVFPLGDFKSSEMESIVSIKAVGIHPSHKMRAKLSIYSIISILLHLICKLAAHRCTWHEDGLATYSLVHERE
jgi:hypothetical protein